MRLICNSIPKSGTYLLGAIAQLCKFQDSNVRFVDAGINVVDDSNNMVRFDKDLSPSKLEFLKDGRYAPSHLTFNSELEAYILDSSFLNLFIYRHPLEILYSYVRFVTYSRGFGEQDAYNADLQNKMKSNFQSDEERICYVFKHMSSSFNFRANLGWLTSKACYPIQFEELYADLVALKSGQLGSVLEGIFKYINYHPKISNEEIYMKIYGVGPTFMAGEDKASQFFRLDQSELAAVINNPDINDVVQRFGYQHLGTETT